MKSIIYLVLVLISAFTGKAQSTRDSVIVVVSQLFEGMKKADTVMLKHCFSPNAVLQTIEEKNSVIKVRDEVVKDFINFVGKETVGSADERITIETVKIDGPMAMVWAPYQFFSKGKFSHCGVNVFELVRLNTGWKIQYIIDTRRKENCL